MSGSTTTFSFNQLPVEILHGIFYYLDIPHILRIRRVSRYLNQVSHNRDVWSDAYRKAEFVRPPGPFLSQSTHELENALVSSFRVNQNLRHGGDTPQRERQTIKLREIRYTGVEVCVCLVFGRFLFVAFSKEVRCYDLNLDVFDSNSGASILYRPTSGALELFHCVSAIDTEGRPFACVVLNELTETARQLSIYLFNVGEQSDMTLDLLHQFEHATFTINAVDLGPRVIVIQGYGYDSDSDRCLVVLDVHTRTEFLLSSPTHPSREAPEIQAALGSSEGITSISTSTHLLLVRTFYTPAAGKGTFFEAFALPPPDTHSRLTSTSLSPSHRGIVPGINVRETLLLHDSILDPTTQDVLIAIRVHASESSHPFSFRSKHGVLRLSNAPTSYANDSEIGTITFQLLGRLAHSRVPFPHPSFNGTGRVFYILNPDSHGIVSALEYNLHTSRGDHGDAHAATVVDYPSILRFSTPRTLLDYDPYSGRICLRSNMAKYSVIEILDLAV